MIDIRKRKIIESEYYHVLNRGNKKQLIFFDDRDRARFLFFILYLQSPKSFFNISRHISYFLKNGIFNVSENITEKIIGDRYVELISFILMPNHFHLILKESKEGGISDYMKRILGGYTKYFNAKYKTSGHLFQGNFKYIHIENDPQLLYLSSYIHNNVRGLKRWNGKENLYPWSSYQDYVKNNRWEKLLKADIIMKQFPNKEKYQSFVQKSGAKEHTIDMIDVGRLS